VTPPRPAAWRAQFLWLAGELSDRDPAVAAAMTLALDDPEVYLERHDETAERLGEDAGGAADPQLPWLALVDRLLAALRAVEIDWRADRDEVVWQLEQLTAYGALPQAIRDDITRVDCHAPDECLNAIARLVARAGHRLALIDIDSESYVVALLDAPLYERATRAAETLGAVLRDIRESE
jgi:hypothetical protein